MKKNFTLLILVCLINFVSYSQNIIALQPVATGFVRPATIENCGDSRLFVVQQTGQIIIIDSTGNKRNKPFLDISDRVLSSGNEQGLLGLAFDPDYLNNGYFYVNYINKSGNTQISRFKANYPNTASPASEKKILQIQQPFNNHNGGDTRFGPDGYLYIGMGDGGSGGDPNNNAQNPQSLLGKMLRIDVHHGNPYSIPADNPFVDSSRYKKEIWALGLRNPWRWSFDALNGNLIIADVGQETWEEVDYQGKAGGKNYGWRCYEGNHAYNTAGCNPQSFYKYPIYEYEHSSTTGDCSIIGGFVYRGKKYSSLKGKYFFTDYCSGIIRTLVIHNPNATEEDVYHGDSYAYTTFGVDNKNEIYLANASNGTIYHIVPVTTALQNANAETVSESFTVAPNPSNGNFIITYKSAKSQKVNVIIQNTLGEPFYKAAKSLNAGTNTISVAMHLPTGEYYVLITNSSGKTINKQIRIE